jgi:hypothetical protein
VGAVVMRNIIWLVVIGLICLGLVVAIKIGASAPAGADVDGAKVGMAVERSPTKANSTRAQEFLKATAF